MEAFSSAHYWARELIHDVWQHYRTTCEEVLSADRKISALGRDLMTIPGIGELHDRQVASVDPKQIENSRQVTAWLGLTLIARRYKRAITAVAARNARLIWTYWLSRKFIACRLLDGTVPRTTNRFE